MTDAPLGTPHSPPPDEPKYWLDSKANVDKLLLVFYAACAILFVIDIVIHKHALFEIEHLFGFYAIYGFIGCSAVILGAKLLRIFVMRSEDYYDR